MLDIKNNSNPKEVYRQKKKKILLTSHPPLKLKLILLLLFLLSEEGQKFSIRKVKSVSPLLGGAVTLTRQ